MRVLDRVTLVVNESKFDGVVADCAVQFGMSIGDVADFLRRDVDSEVWENDVYRVRRRPAQKGVIWLAITRLDGLAVRSWADFQQIKNQLVGAECEAVELYPAESRLVDVYPTYHLWVVEDTAFRFPFGFEKGRVVSEVG